MKKQTFVFMGRSGCGKGTQAKLLVEYIKSMDPEKKDILYLETGNKFRGFVKGDSYSARLSREIMESGKRQPDFIAVGIWGNFFIENIKGNEHLICDGISRSMEEAKLLEQAFDFYKREKPIIVYINVSNDSVIDRMQKRAKIEGRQDDQKLEDIKKRLEWFETDVMPAVNYFKDNKNFIFWDIDGEPAVAEIFEDLKKRFDDLWKKE